MSYDYTDPLIPVIHLPLAGLDELNISICKKVQSYYKELLVEALDDLQKKEGVYKEGVEDIRSNLCHQPKLCCHGECADCKRSYNLKRTPLDEDFA